MRDCWNILGIVGTPDLAAIKRAYAAKLKTLDRERDVEAFQALRAAYEAAIEHARWNHGSVDAAESIDGSFLTTNGSTEASVSALPQEMAPVSASREVPREVASKVGRRVLDEAPVALVDARRTASGIITELLLCVSDEEAELVLREFPVLENLNAADVLSIAIARQLIGNGDIRWSVLSVLVARLGWNDLRQVRRFDAQLAISLTAWLRQREAEDTGSSSRANASELAHMAEVQHLLRTPHGFWRALQIGIRLDLDLDSTLGHLKKHYGTAWRREIGDDTLAFADALAGRRFVRNVWLGRTFGRAVVVAAGAAMVTSALHAMLRIEPPATWAWLAALTAIVLVAAGSVVREMRGRIAPASRFEQPHNGDIMVLVVLIVIGTVAVLMQQGGL